MSTVAVNPIDTNSPAGIAAKNQAINGGGQTLTQQDFLKIMVAQFTSQDPLSSGSGGGNDSGTSDYVNQLMSMTNLTTMQTMSSQLATSTSQQALSLASSLHGATVEVGDANGNVVSGVVTRTGVDSNDNVLMTINGTVYTSANLISIDQSPAQTAASTTTPTNTP